MFFAFPHVRQSSLRLVNLFVVEHRSCTSWRDSRNPPFHRNEEILPLFAVPRMDPDRWFPNRFSPRVAVTPSHSLSCASLRQSQNFQPQARQRWWWRYSFLLSCLRWAHVHCACSTRHKLDLLKASMRTAKKSIPARYLTESFRIDHDFTFVHSGNETSRLRIEGFSTAIAYRWNNLTRQWPTFDNYFRLINQPTRFMLTTQGRGFITGDAQCFHYTFNFFGKIGRWRSVGIAGIRFFRLLSVGLVGNDGIDCPSFDNEGNSHQWFLTERTFSCGQLKSIDNT